jgi:glycogen(starch) synthase
MTPRRHRALFVSSSVYDLPLSPGLARKWDAVSDRLAVRVIGRAGAAKGRDSRFRLVDAPLPGPAGPQFFASLPVLVVREAQSFQPDVVIAQSPYEAAACLPFLRLLRPRAKLVAEVHSDPRTATRLYGSPVRRLYARAADRTAIAGMRGADAVRAISSYTAAIARDATGREPAGVFPTYFDLESFVADPLSPLPEPPQAAWVGALQPAKNPALLDRAWRLVARRMPQARLVVVGDGPLRAVVDALEADLPDSVRAFPRLTPAGVARILDQSTVLALPSASEGLGRVIFEAFARGRPVVATRVGGIPDLVEHERNGLLVPAGDAEALAAALERVLRDPELAERLGRAAAQDGQRARWTPSRYADSLRDLVERVVT